MTDEVLVVSDVEVLVITEEVSDLLDATEDSELLEKNEQGPPGPSVFISMDTNNRLSKGTDDGLFVPDIAADPLAYYILAKA